MLVKSFRYIDQCQELIEAAVDRKDRIVYQTAARTAIGEGTDWQNDVADEVFVNYDRGMKSVLECEPDVILMGADPPNFDCCQLLSEIKGSDKTSHIRVIMLAPGGPAERSFGLDLGALKRAKSRLFRELLETDARPLPGVHIAVAPQQLDRGDLVAGI